MAGAVAQWAKLLPAAPAACVGTKFHFRLNSLQLCLEKHQRMTQVLGAVH